MKRIEWLNETDDSKCDLCKWRFPKDGSCTCPMYCEAGDNDRGLYNEETGGNEAASYDDMVAMKDDTP